MMSPGPLQSAADSLVGAVVSERYRIVRRIGEGGMGRVYEAEHVLIRRRVAIKCLHAHYTSDASVVERFHREALAATSIGNEHIVEVTDMGHFPDGSVYMVLEFLDGRDLMREIATSGPLAVGRAVRVARQVCEALSAAHARGIVHRDLKPENIVLITRGQERDFVKVVDFGVSKFLDGDAEALTGTGTVLGTPHYMAPEQIEGAKEVDHRADLYALGVVLYVALTGRPLFSAASMRRLVFAALMTTPPSVRELRDDVPEALAAILLRLLEKRPEARFQTCEELREALAPFVDIDAAVSLLASEPLAAISGVQRSTLHEAVAVMERSEPSSPELPHTLASPATTLSAAMPSAPERDSLAATSRSRARPIALVVALLIALGVCAARWSSRGATSAPAQPAAPIVAQTRTAPNLAEGPPSTPGAAVEAPVVTPPVDLRATPTPRDTVDVRSARRVRRAAQVPVAQAPGEVRDSIPNL